MKPRLYVPLDVDYLDDEKFDEVSAEAELLYLRALCLCKRRASDGQISTGQLRRINDRLNNDPLDLADELVQAGLWAETDTGYAVVAYLKHNMSKADIEAKQQAEALRKASYRKRDNMSHRTDTSRDAGQKRAGRGTDTSRADVSHVPETFRAPLAKAEAEAETETKAAAAASPATATHTDHDHTLELLLQRRRTQHTNAGGVINNPAAWSRSVKAGLEREHGDRINADLALGLTPETIAETIIPTPPSDYRPPPDHNRTMAAAAQLVDPTELDPLTRPRLEVAK